MRPTDPLLTRNLLLTIGAGFVLSILFMLGVGVFTLKELTQANRQVTMVVSENIAKERMVGEMRDLLKAKTISLLTLVALTDPFDKNDEVVHLYGISDRYLQLRERFDTLPASDEERAVLARLDRLNREYCPIEHKVSELGLQGYTFMAFDVLQNKAIEAQRKIGTVLDELRGMQQQAIREADAEAEHRYRRTRLLVLSLGGVSLLLATLIAVYVLQRTMRLARDSERERTRFYTLFKANTDGILILDGDRPVQCNSAMQTMFGWDNEEAVLGTDPDRLDRKSVV